MGDVIVIGLTGNIATGKSTVMEILARRGAYTIDADELVHQFLEKDPAIQSQVAARFGQIRTECGEVDRAKLGTIVFGDPAGMRDLERILHPHVAARVDRLIADCGARVVVVEAIKLLEGELRHRCQAIWVTRCREDQQMRRLVAGRKMSRHEARARVQSQPSQAEKVARADVVIDTSGSLRETERQVIEAWDMVQGAQGNKALT
jgi:dephospho-CoA kinase